MPATNLLGRTASVWLEKQSKTVELEIVAVFEQAHPQVSPRVALLDSATGQIITLPIDTVWLKPETPRGRGDQTRSGNPPDPLAL